MKQKLGSKAVNPKKVLSDRYKTRSEKPRENQLENDYAEGRLVDEADNASDHSLEARSLVAEIDYTKKDATRHIV